MTEPKETTIPSMFRLRPEARALLEKTANLERRSMASVLESLLRQHLPARISEGGKEQAELPK